MAVEEFETIPRHFVEKVLREKTPKFDTLLAVLKPKMQQYRSKRAARTEFKAVKQTEDESLKDYFRRASFGRFGTFRKITHKKRSGFT